MKIVNGEKYSKEIKELIIEYTKTLGRDLEFQNLSQELNEFPKKYTYPNGALLCALDDDEKVIGCIAYYKHSDKRCEMKRLYVKKEYRKLKLGYKLIDELVKQAKKEGYSQMVLDTLSPMKSAIKLYKNYGFKEIEPYYDNPMDDVYYMALDL